MCLYLYARSYGPVLWNSGDTVIEPTNEATTLNLWILLNPNGQDPNPFAPIHTSIPSVLVSPPFRPLDPPGIVLNPHKRKAKRSNTNSGPASAEFPQQRCIGLRCSVSPQTGCDDGGELCRSIMGKGNVEKRGVKVGGEATSSKSTAHLSRQLGQQRREWEERRSSWQ